MGENQGELAAQKTKAAILNSNFSFDPAGTRIAPKRELKYLGVVLNYRMTYGPRIKYLTEKTQAAHIKIVPNIGGPGTRGRREIVPNIGGPGTTNDKGEERFCMESCNHNGDYKRHREVLKTDLGSPVFYSTCASLLNFGSLVSKGLNLVTAESVAFCTVVYPRSRI
ncbi:hypothetical protein QE152_g27810 [Popillia japonica]|uniref:Uncharacterized protein n=1 Tax=Popillia japonica TaxID=7064 RepID=A0AAW1JL09_POPJA